MHRKEDKHSHQPVQTLTRSTDFFDFWRSTILELDQIQPVVEDTSVLLQRKGLEYREFYFRSLGRVKLHGNLLRWRDQHRRPLIVYTHGYNSQCLDVNWAWAEAGANVIGFDVRGFGESSMDGTSLASDGYVLTGIHDPRASILRGAVCDFIQTARVAKQLLSTPTKLCFYGYSFGGALAFMASAFAGTTPDLLAVGVPTFGWAEGRRKLVKRGSGEEINRYLARVPQQEDIVMRTLSYFDPMNFADLIDTQCLIGIGIDDPVVPPETVYAIVNHMRCNPLVRVFPVSHSKAKEEALWKLFEDEWLTQAVQGDVP